MEYFSYKGRHGAHILRDLKEMVWAIDKLFQYINNVKQSGPYADFKGGSSLT